jgi:hypothetical protein
MRMRVNQTGHDHPPFAVDRFSGGIFLLQRTLLTDRQDAAFVNGNRPRFKLFEGRVHGQNERIDQQGVYLHS